MGRFSVLVFEIGLELGCSGNWSSNNRSLIDRRPCFSGPQSIFQVTSQETSGSKLPIVLLFTGGVMLLLVVPFIVFDIVDTLMLGVFGMLCYITPCDITGIITWYKTLVLVFSFISIGLPIYLFVKSGIVKVRVGESKDSSS